MIFITSEYSGYEDLVSRIGEEKIKKKYEWTYDLISDFLSRLCQNEEDKVQICLNERILMHCILEYYSDIEKVKSAHDLEHTNSMKIYAYLAYWLLRRHPIQIIADDNSHDDWVFANEKFVLSLLMNFLTHGAENKPLIDQDLSIYKAFANSFYYYLKFRSPNPQAIEMILLSFRLGAVFPECKNIQ